MENDKKRKWSKEDEEIIEFFMGLIPIMEDVKADLEFNDRSKRHRPDIAKKSK